VSSIGPTTAGGPGAAPQPPAPRAALRRQARRCSGRRGPIQAHGAASRAGQCVDPRMNSRHPDADAYVGSRRVWFWGGVVLLSRASLDWAVSVSWWSGPSTCRMSSTSSA